MAAGSSWAYDDAWTHISASFHHDSRRDNLSSDTARETIRKASFKPTSRRSSHPRPGRHLPARRQIRDQGPSRPRWFGWPATCVPVPSPRPARSSPPPRRAHPAGTASAISETCFSPLAGEARTAQQMWGDGEAEAEYDIRVNCYLYGKRLRAGSRRSVCEQTPECRREHRRPPAR